MKLIYDIGANDGQDIPYYLLKADKVIAIEANPSLCEEIRNNFPEEIKNGRLVVENIVLATAEVVSPTVSFYIHKHAHVLSQFPKPEKLDDFKEVMLPAKTLKDLLTEYGDPFYIKIDIENYDQEILRELFSLKIFPPYISAESHHPSIFGLLASTGHYEAFKIVDGPTVPKKYQNRTIESEFQTAIYTFPLGSAGPFGEDVDGEWYSSTDFIKILGAHGMGWKDIHATTLESPPIRRNSREVEPIVVKVLLKKYWKGIIPKFKKYISL